MNTKLVMKCHNAAFGCDEQVEKTATLTKQKHDKFQLQTLKHSLYI